MTKTIRLTSAVTVLSAADPVRVFQEFASLDIISRGRAEIVAGRGSFVDAYPLFRRDLADYDALFAEKLNLLLKIRDSELVTWKGRFRAALDNVAIYPRPLQSPLPIWVGVGGTPQSFFRVGSLGLPLMVAIIGGETRRFRTLINLYRQAVDEMHVGYMVAMTGSVARDRGRPPVSRASFEAQAGLRGAFLVGNPEKSPTK